MDNYTDRGNLKAPTGERRRYILHCYIGAAGVKCDWLVRNHMT